MDIRLPHRPAGVPATRCASATGAGIGLPRALARRGGLVAAGVALALGVATTVAGTEPGADAYRAAKIAYGRGDWAAALDGFRAAGAAGHVRALEVAAGMRLAGEALYGAQVPRDRDDARRLFAEAARLGSPVGRAMACTLAYPPGDVEARQRCLRRLPDDIDVVAAP